MAFSAKNTFLAMVFFIGVKAAVFAQCPPSPPFTLGDASCTPRTFMLKAANSPGTYHWYDTITGGDILSVGAVFTTPVLTSTKVYYVSAYNPAFNCESSRVAVYATVLPYAVDTSIYGNNQWNVYCFNGTDYDTFKGFYIDTNLNINTSALWSPDQSPNNGSTACTGYTGCPVDIDQHSISYKRQGFPDGIYSISIVNHHDDFILSIDGKLVMSRMGSGQTYSSVWTGYLTSTSQVDYQWLNYTGTSSATVLFTNMVNPTNLYAGSTGYPQAFCENGDPSPLSDSTAFPPDQSAYVKSGISLFSFPPPDRIYTYSKSPDSIFYSFLSFDISKIQSSTFNNAYLYLRTYERTSYPNRKVYVSAVADTTWNEKVYWGSQPVATSPPLNSTVIYDLQERWYAIDVSSYVLSQRQSGINRLSFCLSDSATSNGPLVFYSRQSLYPPLLVVNKTQGGCTGYTYQWQTDYHCQNQWTDIPGANAEMYDPPAGLYNTTCFRLHLTDGCGNEAYSSPVRITIDPATQGGILSLTEIDWSKGIIQLQSNNGTVVQWEVSHDNFQTVSDTLVTTATEFNYTGSPTGDLYFRALVKSGTCAANYTDTVKAPIAQDFYIFNSFSPNGDGINDVWAINGIERYPDNQVSIVNTMGVIVFEAEHYNNNDVVWNGTHAGQRLPDGTYYYSIHLPDKPIMSGYVVIKR